MTGRELFDQAIQVVLAHEGEGQTKDPDDPGRVTRFGISQYWNEGIDVPSLTREQAIEYYWQHYWDGQNYDKLPEAFAIKAFELSVNMGKVKVGRMRRKGRLRPRSLLQTRRSP